MKQEFTGMLNEHRGILYKVVNLYCDEPEDRKDLFQEIVLQIWRSYPRFRAASQTSTWMYRIALNTAITRLRKIKREPKRRSLIPEDFEIPDFRASPGEKDELLMLRQAIDRLNDVEKAIIILYLEDKTYEDIADVIGISKNNVGVKLNRIKSKLEKNINTSPC